MLIEVMIVTVNWSISTYSKSEKGRRSENEDSCLVMSSAELCGAADALLVVADGMGGRASGAMASKTAVQAVRECFTSQASGETSDLQSVLSKCLESANAAVYEMAGTSPELLGMGTTCVAAAVRDKRAYYAHLGDSRAYILRNGQLDCLTDDHSFVGEKVKNGELTSEQARTSRFRNVITRAVGLAEDSQPDSGSIDVHSGDVLLLCTDGLTTAVRETEIADILCTSSKPKDACDRLVDSALKHGGRDNITVVIGVFGAPDDSVHVKGAGVGRKAGWTWVLPSLACLILGLGVGLFPGQKVLPLLMKQSGEHQAPVKKLIDLKRVAYGDPVPLLTHLPLRGNVLALDQKGFVYIADRQGSLMRVDTSGRMDPSYPSRDTFTRTESPNSPMLATDSQGNLYISDPAGKKILKFDSAGHFITNIGEGKLLSPEALAVDEKGTIYLIDSGRLNAIHVKTSIPAKVTEESGKTSIRR